MSKDGVGDTIHASAVVVDGLGILIRGPSGSGKSSLALALIDDPRMQARLVGDDRLELVDGRAQPVVRAPPSLAGLIEVRGVGIVSMEHAAEAPIALIVDLLPLEACPRHPDENERKALLGQHVLPRLALLIGSPDGVLRVRMALREWIG